VFPAADKLPRSPAAIAQHLVLAGQRFSAGMLFAFLSFRQAFNDRATGFIGQFVQVRLTGLHLNRLGDIMATGTSLANNRPCSIKN
jgi:ABC-type bacteriocin/lantibiotic exporter with double-glycine peptidase domain